MRKREHLADVADGTPEGGGHNRQLQVRIMQAYAERRGPQRRKWRKTREDGTVFTKPTIAKRVRRRRAK
jgi:hypothetical protein